MAELRSRLIVRTSSSDVAALGSSGEPVHRRAERIREHVSRRLHGQNSIIFAVPIPEEQAGGMAWYAEIDRAPIAYADAAESQRAVIRDAVVQSIKAIDAEVARLLASDAPTERAMGEMLTLATEVPSLASLYCVGSQPLLVNWGSVARDDRRDHGILRSLAAPGGVQAEDIYREPRVDPETPGTVPTARPSSRKPGRGIALLVLMGGLIVAAIVVRVLMGCGIGAPFQADAEPFAWLDFCPAAAGSESALARVQERELLLREAIMREREAMMRLDADCGLARATSRSTPAGSPPAEAVAEAGSAAGPEDDPGANVGPVLPAGGTTTAESEPASPAPEAETVGTPNVGPLPADEDTASDGQYADQGAAEDVTGESVESAGPTVPRQPVNAGDTETECGYVQPSGSGTSQPPRRVYLGSEPGTVMIRYCFANMADKLSVYYDDELIDSTGVEPVSGSGSFDIDYRPRDGIDWVDVVVTSEEAGTRWCYSLSCPRNYPSPELVCPNVDCSIDPN